MNHQTVDLPLQRIHQCTSEPKELELHQNVRHPRRPQWRPCLEVRLQSRNSMVQNIKRETERSREEV